MNPENVLAEFERAKKALRAAHILHADGLLEDAISRSYYAVMHGAKAALLVHDSIAESHAALRRLFGQVLVRPGLIEKEWAAILGREQDERIAADYVIGTSWEPEDSSRLVAEAATFVERIRDYLVSVGLALEE